MELNLGLNHALDLLGEDSGVGREEAEPAWGGGAGGSARRDEVSNTGRQRLYSESKGRAGSAGAGRAGRRPRGTHLARKAHDVGSLMDPVNRAASAVGEAANSSATARTTHALTDRVRPDLSACPIASEGLRNAVLVARCPLARVWALEDTRTSRGTSPRRSSAPCCVCRGGEKRRGVTTRHVFSAPETPAAALSRTTYRR